MFRMLAFARPYLTPIGLAAVFSLLFSAGRYGRALLLKPVFDNVLLPAQAGEVSALSLSVRFMASPPAASTT